MEDKIDIYSRVVSETKSTVGTDNKITCTTVNEDELILQLERRRNVEIHRRGLQSHDDTHPPAEPGVNMTSSVDSYNKSQRKRQQVRLDSYPCTTSTANIFLGISPQGLISSLSSSSNDNIEAEPVPRLINYLDIVIKHCYQNDAAEDAVVNKRVFIHAMNSLIAIRDYYTVTAIISVKEEYPSGEVCDAEAMKRPRFLKPSETSAKASSSSSTSSISASSASAPVSSSIHASQFSKPKDLLSHLQNLLQKHMHDVIEMEYVEFALALEYWQRAYDEIELKDLYVKNLVEQLKTTKQKFAEISASDRAKFEQSIKLILAGNTTVNVRTADGKHVASATAVHDKMTHTVNPTSGSATDVGRCNLSTDAAVSLLSNVNIILPAHALSKHTGGLSTQVPKQRHSFVITI